VSIGHDADTLKNAVEHELTNQENTQWMRSVDEYLADKSWEHTFSAMQRLMLSVKKQETPVVLTRELKSAS